MRPLRIVSASQLDETRFWRFSRLGSSLKKIQNTKLHVSTSISFENTDGLPTVYNRAIKGSDEDEILIFVHDDIYIDDYMFAYRVNEGLNEFAVIGIAGNTNPREDHVGWYYRRSEAVKFFKEDDDRITGVIANFVGAKEVVSFFGPMPQKCELLDGCFLAARSRLLQEAGVLFDEQFSFHFYDMDFSRTCRKRGLKIGTWPIALTHASGGKFGSPPWEAALTVYRQKWKQ